MTQPGALAGFPSKEGLKILGYIDYKFTGASHPENIPCLGSLAQFDKILREKPIDDVYVLPENIEDLNLLKGIMVLCEEQGKNVHLVSDFFNTIIAKLSIDPGGTRHILNFHTTPQN